MREQYDLLAKHYRPGETVVIEPGDSFKVVARNVLAPEPDELFRASSAVVNGRGDTPNMHDVLTGSQPDGTKSPDSPDMTCGNWTKSGAGTAMVGHSDRTGLDESAPAKSWNSSHPSRGPDGGCSQNDLKSTGGNGFLYCFAAN